MREIIKRIFEEIEKHENKYGISMTWKEYSEIKDRWMENLGDFE